MGKRVMLLVLSTILVSAVVGCRGDRGGDGVSTVGDMGPAGAPGATGPQGDQGAPGSDGSNGTNGTDGAQGPAGADGTQITIVKLCPGTTSYPSVFVEIGMCIEGKLYGVYSANNGFLTYLPNGAYSSNAIGSACNLTVNGCSVSH